MYQQYIFIFKTRDEDPSLMNAFQKRNFKLLVDPTEQGFLFRTKRKRTIQSVRYRAHYYKIRTILQSSDDILRSMYFSRSTEGDPFVQSITNDDVLANIIRMC